MVYWWGYKRKTYTYLRIWDWCFNFIWGRDFFMKNIILSLLFLVLVCVIYNECEWFIFVISVGIVVGVGGGVLFFFNFESCGMNVFVFGFMGVLSGVIYVYFIS